LNGQEARSPKFAFSVEGIDFLCRVPGAYTPDSRVVVLFGGRNWPAGKTLDAFGFGETADGCGLFLLAPSFAGDDYWQPKSGTGRVVCRAVDVVRRRHGLKPRPAILYGYSAGGQCAALFADWMRGEVGAWGAHACGVFPNGAPPRIPALVTCGEDDVDRLRISRTFACGAREAGCPVLLRTFHGVGHGLEVDALDLVRLWIRDVSRPDCRVVSWGEDDTWRVRPLREIDAEYRNPLYSSELAEAWRR
jgi:poly(3-hydroxybutyrate) depolymerase